MPEIRLSSTAVGLSDADNLDPITGRRVLLIQELDGEGKPTGYAIVCPIAQATIEHLHRQTSPIVKTSDVELEAILGGGNGETAAGNRERRRARRFRGG